MTYVLNEGLNGIDAVFSYDNVNAFRTNSAINNSFFKILGIGRFLELNNIHCAVLED